MRRILPLFLVLFASFVGGSPPQETHPSTPGLTSAEALIELDIPATMKRANEALLAAKLTLHKPLPQTVGASNEHVFALINADQEENGKVRVIVSVASNPAQRGEAPRVCNFLIEYMKTGKAPAAGLDPKIAGVWEWNMETYTGPAKSNLTLHANGDVTSADAGWPKGTWWTEGSKVCVYWPSPFPKENRHYVNEFQLNPDGVSMKLAKPDYYYKSVTATRIGDLPVVTGGTGSTGGEAVPESGGFVLPTPAADEIGIRFEPPKFPPAPMPLPPVGGGIKVLSEPSADQFEVSIASVSAVHQPANHPSGARGDGHCVVDVVLSDPAPRYEVRVYVGGFLASPTAEIEPGLRLGHQAACRIKALEYETYKNEPERGARRRYGFDTPLVLPATVRAELWVSTPRDGYKYVSHKETLFDVPTWKDYKLLAGLILGKTASGDITKLAALGEAGTTEFQIHIPGGSNRNDRSFDLRLGRRFPEGKSEIMAKVDAGIPKNPRMKEMKIDVGPFLEDRDRRNNSYYPNLPNGGYVEGPVVIEGG